MSDILLCVTAERDWETEEGMARVCMIEITNR